MGSTSSAVIGLVGAGRWGAVLLGDLVALGATVVVADTDEHARDRARRSGAHEAVASIDALPSCAAYMVVTPARSHAAVVRALLDRGAPIFVEKPFTTDAADARDLAERGAHQIFALEKWRHHPGIERLAQVVADGDLGAIESIATTRIDRRAPAHDVDAVWTLLPHDLSIVAAVLGHIPAPVSASAEHDDAGEPCGLTAHLSDGSTSVVIDVSACRAERRRRVAVVGSKATAVLASDDATAVDIERNDGTSETSVLTDEIPTRRMMAAVLAQLGGGAHTLPSAEEASRSVLVIDTLRQLAGIAGHV